MNKGPRTHKKRLNRDGLPVDRNDWTAADWQDLHEAIERVKRTVAARHKPKGDDHATDGSHRQ